jgi:hypothetical protein
MPSHPPRAPRRTTRLRKHVRPTSSATAAARPIADNNGVTAVNNGATIAGNGTTGVSNGSTSASGASAAMTISAM